MKIIATEILED